MLDHVLKDAHVQLVDDLLPHPRREHEPGVAEHGEVARDGRPRGIEVLRDLPGRPRAVPQEPEDVAAGWVGEGSEGSIHDYNIS